MTLDNYPTVNPTDNLGNNTNIYFTSDLHIGHKKVIKADNRPFKDLDEMFDTLVKNWNNVVSDNSIIYLLGDLTVGGDLDYVKSFVHQLKGEIRFVLGNHDDIDFLLELERFTDIQTYKQVILKDDNGVKRHLELSHYPHLSWNKCSRGYIHLHGHSHQVIHKLDYGNLYYSKKVMDVGCMGHNYTPVSLNYILDIMDTRL